MEPRVLRVAEADVLKDMATILKCVESGTEVVVQRNNRPVAVIRPADTLNCSLDQAIELAKTDEERSGQPPTLDPDFAADVQEIVSNRKPRNGRSWD